MALSARSVNGLSGLILGAVLCPESPMNGIFERLSLLQAGVWRNAYLLNAQHGLIEPELLEFHV